MSTPARKPALTLTKAPAKEHPLAPAEPVQSEPVGEEAVSLVPAQSSERSPRGMGMLSARIDLDLRHDVKRYAVDQDVTVQAVIEQALREFLDKHAR